MIKVYLGGPGAYVRDAEPNSALDEKHIEIREEIHLVAC
jgi:hypothetical protein